MNKMNKMLGYIKYFSYGLQFTMIIIAPFLVCIYLGGYIQKKYNLGDWVMVVSVVLAVVVAGGELVTFAKVILRDIDKKSKK